MIFKVTRKDEITQGLETGRKYFWTVQSSPVFVGCVDKKKWGKEIKKKREREAHEVRRRCNMHIVPEPLEFRRRYCPSLFRMSVNKLSEEIDGLWISVIHDIELRVIIKMLYHRSKILKYFNRLQWRWTVSSEMIFWREMPNLTLRLKTLTVQEQSPRRCSWGPACEKDRERLRTWESIMQCTFPRRVTESWLGLIKVGCLKWATKV